MSGSKSHKRSKGAAAGRNEGGISRGWRIDSVSQKRATEIERSGNSKMLIEAARRLKAAGRQQNVLQVPNADMDEAAVAMRFVGVKGTVKNMGGTKRRSV